MVIKHIQHVQDVGNYRRQHTSSIYSNVGMMRHVAYGTVKSQVDEVYKWMVQHEIQPDMAQTTRNSLVA